MAKQGMLIAFSGLPAVGKSSLAKALAAERGALYLRIDTIEQALRKSGELAGPLGPAGYLVAHAVAADNLGAGAVVVADAVNPLAVSRDAWAAVAARAGADFCEIEVVYSDPAEHRRRAEARGIGPDGLIPPNWDAIVNRNYEPWTRGRLVIDTAGGDVAAGLVKLRQALEIWETGE